MSEGAENVGTCGKLLECVAGDREDFWKLQVIDQVMSWYMTVLPSYGQALEGCSGVWTVVTHR